MTVNITALEALPQAAKTSRIPAYLELINENSKLTFLYNPQEKALSTSATYTEAPTFGASIPDVIYQHGGALTLSLSNLLIDTYCDGKSAQPLLDSYVDLTKSRKPVNFVWGAGIFGPAVVINVSWKETYWLNGLPAFVSADITLQQIPKDVPVVEADSITEDSIKNAALTERQREEGLSVVSKALGRKASEFSIGSEGGVVDKKTGRLIGNYNGVRFIQ